MQVSIVIFELGTLTVFRIETHDGHNIWQHPGFYWKDKLRANNNGPFGTIYETVEHYKNSMRGFLGVSDKKCPVIEVNFNKNK